MPGVAADNVAAGADNVLSDASILRHIIGFVDFGYWLPVAAVNSSWHKAYSSSIKVVKVHQLLRTCDADRFDRSFIFFNRNYGARSTSYSAVCKSLSTLAMAQQHGLIFQLDDWRLQRIAGRTASIEVLVMAHEFGMPYSHQVLVGAAESGNINTLQWLHNEQGCAITSDLSCFAAASGCINVLDWLLIIPEYTFDWKTSLNAARGGHLHVLKYLAAKSVTIDATACAAAARIGALDILQWFDEAGIKWKHRSVYIAAAECGSIEMMHWLTQGGAVYDAQVMKTAAENGHLDICKHLREHGCQWNSQVTLAARKFEIIKWLHENGCPWNVDLMLLMNTDRHICKYVIAESGVTVSKLSELLNMAGIEFDSDIGESLREQDAEWPTVLKRYGTAWKPEMIEWARSQGCTSPTS
jgi:hypothetical protein